VSDVRDDGHFSDCDGGLSWTVVLMHGKFLMADFMHTFQQFCLCFDV
jgi:hypothetical protein